ncbi:hypothetical protein C4D60_Mb04t03040 [Musa balbisiana]|uniref:Uncharacterized protein n=1 Tax=Musa balbisiana TaxID=52838 RepID=A0A4S8K9C5_MUSBA|nr:hypothetical protein C4D60_Mb04t03040 [Musa balbisiana]
MGICTSCDATTVTVKLVLQDGTLQQFSRPVKASRILDKHPSCFVCNADNMKFNDFVSPVDADSSLPPCFSVRYVRKIWPRSPSRPLRRLRTPVAAVVEELLDF